MNEDNLKSLKIAFFPLLRTTFDVVYAQQMIDSARQSLLHAGFDLIEPEQPIKDIDDAVRAASLIAKQQIDTLLIFQATFADSTMVTTLTKSTTSPIFLWAVPEGWTGGRLRLNSLCGINLAGHALTRQGQKYYYGYGPPDDEAVLKKLQTLSKVGALKRYLESTKLGVIGEHPEGFDSCHLDKDALNSAFGIQVESIPLETIFDRARGISEQAVSSVRTELDQILDNLSTLDQNALMGTLRVYVALRSVAKEKGLDGLAVRCWPEFFTEMGCAACGAMSMLSDGFSNNIPIPCSCEADINGTVTQLILQYLSAGPSFGTDIVGVDRDKNQIALWHCGLAPLSMANPDEQPHGTIHSNRQLPLLMDFTLKPGGITFARISQAGAKLQLVIGEGEMLNVPKPFSGTAGTLRPNCNAEYFLDSLLHQGLEHHLSMTYGHFATEFKLLAECINLRILMMDDQEVKI